MNLNLYKLKKGLAAWKSNNTLFMGFYGTIIETLIQEFIEAELEYITTGLHYWRWVKMNDAMEDHGYQQWLYKELILLIW